MCTTDHGSGRRDPLIQEVICVVGARPNFVKVAPVVHALHERSGVRVKLLHTGQHYDRILSDAFVEQLGLPAPAFHLGVGSGTHAEQTAAVLVGVEAVLREEPCDVLLVPGDVNSTMAAALAATKLGVAVAHLESGLRSGDWTMPEEVNRVVTDRVSDVLLCHSQEAVENLAAEGIASDAVALVGNTMIDSLQRLQPAAAARLALDRHHVAPGGYVLVTLHRPALVDDEPALVAALSVLAEIAERMPVLFPLHPRTRARLDDLEPPSPAGLRLVDPLEYLDFIALEAEAALVITDSGGVQEETSALGVPCLTYRDTTERPITVRLGTNRLVGVDPHALLAAATKVLDGAEARVAARIPLWDGRAGERAGEALAAFIAAHWQARPGLDGVRSPPMKATERLKHAARELISPATPPTVQDMGESFHALAARLAPFTMTGPERLFALHEAVRYLVDGRVPGAFVECGVWRGGSSMMAALTLNELGERRPLWLYDTFEGMPPPGDEDVKWTGTPAADELAAAPREAGSRGTWSWATLDDVRANMAGTGYPEELVTYVEGKVEDTLPAQAPDEIALLRLDTDWYESTRHELEQLWPRLSPRGVLIVDDYGHWQGARKAVDEFFASEPLRPLLVRVDYTGRIAVKP